MSTSGNALLDSSGKLLQALPAGSVTGSMIAAATITANNLYPFILQTNGLSVTALQLSSVHTAPVTIIPAAPNAYGSSHTIVIIDDISLRLNFNTIQYAGTNNLEVRYTNGAGLKVTDDIPFAFLNSGVAAYAAAGKIATTFVPVIDAPIVLSMPTADPTLGNSPIDIQLRYHIIYLV